MTLAVRWADADDLGDEGQRLEDMEVDSPSLPERVYQLVEFVRYGLQFALCGRVADGETEELNGVAVDAGAADGVGEFLWKLADGSWRD